MTVKLLTEHNLEFLSLKGGVTGSSESTFVKMTHCWKYHAAAQLFIYLTLIPSFFVPENAVSCRYSSVPDTRFFHEANQEAV